jgi:hypothetical protein
VNNSPLKITANLFEAMRRLRDKEENRTLWIDAVCINQRDMAERSQQVLYMGKIFSTVCQVAIWLGKEEYVSTSGLALSPRELKQLNTNQVRAVAGMIFDGNWWYKSWTVQEFLNARSPVFVCGSLTLSWVEVTHILELFVLHHNENYNHIYNFVQSKNSHKDDMLRILMIDLDIPEPLIPKIRYLPFLVSQKIALRSRRTTQRLFGRVLQML